LIELEDYLARASARRDAWSPEIAWRVAEDLAARQGADLDWDPDAGEGWITVLVAGQAATMIAVDLPLMIVTDGGSAAPNDIVRIVVPDFGSKILRCSPDVLEESFGYSIGRDGIDFERLSASDLRWSTI